ncbi:diaminopimelate epimerase [bacterium]|nr:diaminopimelate epimerase [bacterium]
MTLSFSKYHGAGNDFIMVNNLDDDRRIWSAMDADTIASLCTRHHGIGADGLIVAVRDSGNADYRMGYFNADGSPAEMCGNGLRCLMRYLADLGEPIQDAESVNILTGAGVVAARFVENDRIQISMPVPSFDPKDAQFKGGAKTIHVPVSVPGLAEPLYGTAVGVGNPHFVLFNTEMWEGDDVHEIGSRMAIHKDIFPEGVNVGFARREAEDTLALVVYERGVGPTLACGSGAIAAAGAAVAQNMFPYDEPVTVRMPGGMLAVTIGKDWEYAILEGEAVKVFEGTVSTPFRIG